VARKANHEFKKNPITIQQILEVQRIGRTVLDFHLAVFKTLYNIISCAWSMRLYFI